MSVAKIFDQSFYLSNNADVAVAISQGVFADAAQHFNLFGAKELRDPNASFDASYYAAQNPDVLAAVSSGLIASVFAHYQSHGEAENRAPAAAFEGFDGKAYLEANADVKEAVEAGSFASALDHYIAFGKEEGRGGADVTTPTKPGTMFNLTDELESLNGTGDDDTFRGTDETTSAGDLIDGGAGNDTFMAFSTSTIPQMVSIENLVVDNVDDNLSTTGRTGLENVTLQNSILTADKTVTLANGEALTLINHEGAFNVGLSTTKASETIILNDVGSIKDKDVDIDLTASAADVTELTLNGTGASSDVDIEDTDDKLETLKITGDQNIDVEIVDITNSLKTYDASAATTGQTFAVDATSTSDLTITGSAGDDSFNLGNTLTKADTIDGGEGNDTLRIDTFVSSVTTAITIAGDLQISNVETLRVDDGNRNTTIDLDDVAGLTTLRVGEDEQSTSVANKVIFNNVASTATTIQLTGDGKDLAQDFDTVKVDYDGSDVAAKVEISNEVEAKGVILNGIEVDGAKSLSIDASNVGTDSGEQLEIKTINGGSDLEKVSIKSNSDIKTKIESTTNLSDLDLSGSNAGIDFDLDTIKADAEVTLGDGTNKIDIQGTGTTAFKVILGDGVDTIVLSGAATNGGIEIEDFDTSEDIIDFNASAVANVTNGTKFFDFVATTGAEFVNGFTAVGSSASPTDLTAANVKTFLGTATNFGNTAPTLDAANAVHYIAVDNGTDTGIYHVAADTDQKMSSANFTQLVVLKGVSDATSLSAANFADFLA